ncbi:MAG: hypothetical protein KF784_01230 [Fimbriimonadaceae bacterium]|nr:hypothetical protein [Fimbriimonadaceae bacterium]
MSQIPQPPPMPPPPPIVNPPEGKTPKAWIWYRALCILLVLIQGFLAWLGYWIRTNAEWFHQEDPSQAVATYRGAGDFLIVCAIVFAILNIVIIFLPRKRWAYALHVTNVIAAIALCCPAPLAIWVLVMIWKPENRRWYDA